MSQKDTHGPSAGEGRSSHGGARKSEPPSGAPADSKKDGRRPTKGKGLTRHELRRRRSVELRRALTLTGFSTLWPGAGLLGTRAKRLGMILAGGALLTFLLLTYLLLNKGILTGVAGFATKNGLRALLALCLLGGLTWIAGILLTHWLTTGRRWPRRMTLLHRTFTFVMVLVVAVPAVQATRYVVVTQDAFGKIFTDRYDGRGGAANGPGEGPDPWADVDRVSVLLVGSDAGTDREGIRTDSLMVATIDPKTGDTNLISIPRNLQRVPFPADNPLHEKYPEGFYCPERGVGSECLMDAVWMEAENNKDLFPEDEANPGLNTTREVVGAITGLDIDYTAVVDLSGFRQLVDAMGGVYINVPGPEPGLPIGGRIVGGAVVPGSITGYIKPGYQKLDGQHALWYARSRVLSSDDDRMRRQRCMVNALIDQTDPFKMATKFTGIMDAAGDNITVDIPQDDLPAFAELADRMKRGNLRTINISKVTTHWKPDFTKIQQAIQKALAKPHNPKAPKPGATSSESSTSSSTSSTTTTTPPGPSTSSTTSVNPISDTADDC